MIKDILNQLESFYQGQDWNKLEEAMDLTKSADPSINLDILNASEAIQETLLSIKDQIPLIADSNHLKKVIDENKQLSKLLRGLRISILSTEAGNSTDYTQYLLRLEKTVDSQEEQLIQASELIKEEIKNNN